MKARDRYAIEGAVCRFSDRLLQVTNLSVGGLFAATDEPPLPGQVIALDLIFPGHRSFHLVGQVTWINASATPRAPHLPTGFGVRIVRVAFPDKLALLDVLKRHGRALREGRA